MASIHFTEKDYDAVAAAIYDFHIRGENEAAESLDALAKRMNAALSVSRYKGVPKYEGMTADAPSPLETLRRLDRQVAEKSLLTK